MTLSIRNFRNQRQRLLVKYGGAALRQGEAPEAILSNAMSLVRQALNASTPPPKA